MKKRLWTLEEIEYLKTHYAKTHISELTKQLDFSDRSIYSKAFLLGLKKDPEFLLKQNQELVKKLEEKGKAYRFKKGEAPMNKGKKMEEYMSPEAIKRTQKTRFKKGNKPDNTKPIGSLSIIKETKSEKGYVYLKLADSNWMLYHRWLWEKHYGPIKKGSVIYFKDGNSLNCVLENLGLKSRKENLNDNTGFDTLSDKYVLRQLGRLPGRGKYDLERTNKIKKHPELIELKRTELKLKRLIKNYEKQ